MGEQKVVEEPNVPSTDHKLQVPRGNINDNPFFHPTSKRFRKLPAWLDHFNAKDLKILFKCSAAVWIYTLFMLINPTLRVLGQASFFGSIVLFMAPPSGVVFIGLLAGVTLLIGVCLGWAWGTITMKAALATRPTADLNAQYAALQQSLSRNTTNIQQASGQSTYAQIAIYNGAMLDTRVSVTYFCMLSLFIYFMARLRVKAPKLTLTVIFSIIITDIYITIAPLIPTFTGTIPQTLIKPAAIAVGVALVCNILFFPRSTSHIVLDDMQTFLAPMGSLVDASLIHFQDPSKHLDLGRLKQTKAQVIGTFKAMEGNLAFLSLDASMGKWSASDVSSLHKPLRQVLVTFMGLLQLQIGRREFIIKDEKLLELAETFGTERREDFKAGFREIVRTFDSRQRLKDPESERLKDASLRALGVSSVEIVDACLNGLHAITDGLHSCNTRRWYNRPSKEDSEASRQSHVSTLDQLRKCKNEFAQATAEHLWNPHSELFDNDGHLFAGEHYRPPPTAGLMLGLVFEEKIFNFAQALENVLSQVVALEGKRSKTRLWLPEGIMKLFTWGLEDEKPGSISVSSDTTSDSSEKKTKSKRFKKNKKKEDADAVKERTAASQLTAMQRHGGTKRSKSGKLLVGFVHWIGSTEGLYALRMVVVTVAIGVIGVIPTSAGFFYREKGLWALIMAQTGLLPYTADFVFGLVTRLIGTLIGAIIGLAAWYIGAGNGPGNPYGMAAIMAVIIVVLMWLRLYLSPAFLQAIVLVVATCYLVVGYSWDDTHIPSYGNPGVGYSVFWRRMLLVLIGFTAAAFVTFFPRPPSASRHQRRLLSESIETTKNQYALFASNCQQPLPDLLEVAEKSAIASGEILLEIEPQLQLLKFEFSTSNFDAKTLGLVCHLCMNLNQSTTQLILYATQLPDELKKRFIKVTGSLEETTIADIMAVLTLVQQALRSGEPLPVILPVPLLARTIDSIRTRVSPEDIHSITFNAQILSEVGVRKYCSAMAAFFQMLGSIDELVILVKRVVGETSYVDLER